MRSATSCAILAAGARWLKGSLRWSWLGRASIARRATTRSTRAFAPSGGPRSGRKLHSRVGLTSTELFPPDDLFVMHRVPFRKGICHIENLGGDLASVGTKRCVIGAFPIPIIGGEASPCRVIAFVDAG